MAAPTIKQIDTNRQKVAVRATGKTTVGSEWVWDPRSNTVTRFLVLSVSVDYGPNSAMMKLINQGGLNFSVSAYYSPIYNVDDVVQDYAGEFIG